MSYNKDFLARITSSGCENAPVWWSYQSLDDSLATIMIPGYFNEAQAGLSEGKGKFGLGDVINIKGTDGTMLFIITNNTGNIVIQYYMNNDLHAATFDSYGVIKLATGDEAVAGANADKAMTPATVDHLLKFDSLNQTNGFRTFSGGVVMNWGESIMPGGTYGPTEIYFGKPPQRTYNVQIIQHGDFSSKIDPTTKIYVDAYYPTYFTVSYYPVLLFYDLTIQWLSIGGPA